MGILDDICKDLGLTDLFNEFIEGMHEAVTGSSHYNTDTSDTNDSEEKKES